MNKPRFSAKLWFCVVLANALACSRSNVDERGGPSNLVGSLDNSQRDQFSLDEDQADDRPSEVIEGSYIVLFKSNDHKDKAMKRRKVKSKHVFSHAVHGFSGKLSREDVDDLLKDPSVVVVEQDLTVHGSGLQSGATWGLDRIDQHVNAMDGKYNYNFSGAAVNAYIIDTGIRYDHLEFGGRAVFGFDAFGGNGVDGNGHGTHVSGTVGGTTYGVAKNVRLYGVRVLDAAGSGTTSGVIAGVDWVVANRQLPAVANMSLGGGISTALDTAIGSLIGAGVTVVLAAGNSNADACNTSPARVPAAITVGATSSNDARASFSNFGSCVDWFAPGVSITSAWNTSSSATSTINGTSMASPHVAGVVALYLEHFPAASPAAVRTALFSFASKGVVTNSLSVNSDLLYSLEDTVVQPPTDTTAPVTSIVSPAAGSLLSGIANVVSVAANDSVGVVRVDLLLDGLHSSTLSVPPYNFNVDSNLLTNGGHSLQSKAYDAAGNSGLSAALAVIVDNSSVPLDSLAPIVSLTSPTSATVILRGSSVLVAASATDNVGVERVDFVINGATYSDFTAPYSYSWKVPKAKGRTYNISAKAYDKRGNVGTSSVFSVSP